MNGRPTPRRGVQTDVYLVKELIKEGKWDRYLLNSIFCSEDAENVAKIPLSLYNREDTWGWNYSKAGVYSVKSGYALAEQLAEETSKAKSAKEQSSHCNRMENLWKHVWGLKVKFKLKHFLWKCLHNCLPVNEMIHRRTGIGTQVCTICGEGVGTVEHVLFDCESAKRIWKLSPVHGEN